MKSWSRFGAVVMWGLIVTACDSSNDDGQADASAEPADPDAPKILSFGTNVNVLEEDRTVRFVAIVTDSEGLDTLAGGTLSDPTGATRYGAFLADDQGSYQLDLSWDQLHESEPIHFNMPSAPRSFLAEFFDQDGHRATASAAITLSCESDDGPPSGACDGECTFLYTTNNCGGCGVACDESQGCNGAACVSGSLSSETSYTADTLPSHCAEHCSARGSACVDGCFTDFFGFHVAGLLSDGGSTAGTKDCYGSLQALQPNEPSLKLTCCCE